MTAIPQDPQLNPHALAEALSGVHLIDGELVPAASGATFDVVNPATMKVIANAARGDSKDVERAIASCEKAGKGWSNTPPRERGKMVIEFARLLEIHARELGLLVALETGKALRTESQPEANGLADAFYFYGGLGSELKGESLPWDPAMMAITTREPIGIVGAIIPWNAPMLLMALKVAPALVAGNTIVVKSAEEAPLAVLRVCEIANRVLPPGVFNMLSGDGPECGAPIVEHPKVAKVTFTGSVDTGRIVYKSAAERIVPVTLELGGKSPMIVFSDADLDKAVDGAVGGMRFTRQGQSCTAASRIFVHDDLHDEFLERIVAKVNAMVMGDPLDEATDIGSIISPQQFATVNKYIDIGKNTPGSVAHVCNTLPTDPALADGLFVQPVIFSEIDNNQQINREEIFGPVTCVLRWTDPEDVIAQANDTDFGLAATVWTRDIVQAVNAARSLEAGFVQINQNLVVKPGLSYGGIKLSGLGKEASLEAMLEHFTTKKTILISTT